MSSAAEDTAALSPSEAGVDIAGNLKEVRDKVEISCKDAGRSIESVRLVAVSKTKPLSYIKEAYYESGQKVFGENYAQELEEKAQEMGADEHYKNDIQWHFIGGLQSNKAAKLVKNVVPYGKLVVETLNSEKVANKLDNAMTNNFPPGDDGEPILLDVFVQVNTSGEESKSGVSVDESIELCKHVVQNCKRLNLKGVMTIGAPGDIDCLEGLGKCRDLVADALSLDPSSIELSMGMSGDFETAITKGSTNIRVGSTIFGQRDYANKT
jgi:pyridoxal phosphate enzyme (YggS family)